jgi:diguanylate cyclase (GGDEF)-like protein
MFPTATAVAEYDWLAFACGAMTALALFGCIGFAVYRNVRRQQLGLATAINHMSQGLTMFDKAERLVLCNDRYVELYGLSRNVVKPGCSVRQLVDHRIETGTITPSEVTHYVKLRRAAVAVGKTSSHLVELPDHRTVVVTRCGMLGGGWVATHEDITERRQAEAQIIHMAHHDALTDLPNRVLLREQLEAALVRVRRGEQLAILYLDLDHFKEINDTLGHAVGDGLLKAVAGRLRECLRETDTVARLGGDEFAVIQRGIERPADAATLAQRIREAVTTPFDIDGHHVHADVSIGISIAPNDALDPDQLLKNADMALYGAKSEGRSTVRFFEPEMDARVKARRTLEADLRNALANGEFELYYQPLFNLERDEICGCEALLRWNHPERGMVPPAEFIPIAEESGLINPLGEWVVKQACAEAATWPKEITVAVNVSPIQFKSPGLVLTVVNALAASGLAPHRLSIEITEAVLMRDTDATLAMLHELRALGVRIVMDDFGTGYSSLSHLCSFPFDKIKIDRSFINDLSEGTDAGAMVQALTSLASNLNMTTTAEGAETLGQLERIRAFGCTELQGYLYSRPKRADDIAALLLSRTEKVANAG